MPELRREGASEAKAEYGRYDYLRRREAAVGECLLHAGPERGAAKPGLWSVDEPVPKGWL